jgi:hypothetical protein
MESAKRPRKNATGESKAKGNLRQFNYRAGMPVPQDGVYRVQHNGHRVPHEVTLLAGGNFPPCSHCGGVVTFELVRGVSKEDTGRFHVTLYQLPVIDEEEDDGGLKKAG